MALADHLVGKLISPKPLPNKPENKKFGTVYAVSDGYILTAYHVFPGAREGEDLIDDFQKSQVDWRTDAEIKDQITPDLKSVTEVVYASYKYDIVLAKCVTPSQTPSVIWCNADKPTGHWESIGFPASAINHDLKTRQRTSVGGKILAWKGAYWVQELHSLGDADKPELWRGVSGAPVFIEGTNTLISIIIETPRQYWVDKQTHEQVPKTHPNAMTRPVNKERLYAVSIPYLLKKCNRFKQAIATIKAASSPQFDTTKAVDVLKKKPHVFKRLREHLALSPESDEHAVCQHLLSLSVKDFSVNLKECSQQDEAFYASTLGELAMVLLPHFSSELAEKIHDKIDHEVVEVSCSGELNIEALMANIDQRPLALNKYNNQDGKKAFDALYSLSSPPETAENGGATVQDATEHLSAAVGADLMALHTQRLLSKVKPPGVSSQYWKPEQIDTAVQLLLKQREASAPHYYLIQKNDQCFEAFKEKFKQCAVLKSSEDFLLQMQELEDYGGIDKVLTPYVNSKNAGKTP